MYRSLLSALLLGLFPSYGGVSPDAVALQRVDVAPPSQEIHIEGRLSASGVVIYDLQSGQKVYGFDTRVQRPMASLTKLMTALLIVEHHALDEIVTIPKQAADIAGNKAYLSPGQHFTVGDLLSALLINSANDAAVTLAVYHSGSIPAFAMEMNARALQLGMTGTSFRNPSGLDDPAHWSTPQDIAGLTMFALRDPEIASRLSSAGRQISSQEGETIRLYHTHAMMHESTSVAGGKTGTTTEAGQCLMSLVKEGEQQYVVVLLDSNQRYKDMLMILDALGSKSASVAVRDR